MNDALRKIDEYRQWLGSHEFPEVSRVLDNLHAELSGAPLNAGTPGKDDNCLIGSLREQLRAARALASPQEAPPAAGAAQAVALPAYGALPWETVRAYVEAAVGSRPIIDPEYFIGHQIVGVNYNSLNRIMSALAATPAPEDGEAKGILIAARFIEERRENFDHEHCTIDPETGAAEQGRGAKAQAAEDYSTALAELADDLRSLAAQPKENK